MANTIVNKIKQSVQSGTGLTCLYGSLDSINVQMEDQTNFPVAFFVLLNNGNLNDRSSNYRERVDVAMFFVQPTEFDFESVENEALIEQCKQYAFQWLNSLFLGGELRYITTFNTSRVYNEMDSILTGFALRVRIEELVGQCAPEPFKTTCKVTATSNDTTIGTVTGGGVYEIGKPVTLTASWDSTRSNFVSWTVNGTVVSTEPTYTFTAEEDVSVVGNFSLNYLTITAELGGYIRWSGTYPDIQYSKDGSTWTQFTEPVLLDQGEYVMFRGDNWTASGRDSHFEGYGATLPQFNISGNIMSLVDSNIQTSELTMDNEFFYLFSNTCFIGAGELILPATTLTAGCYMFMFEGSCITTAPELPATTLANYCYQYMFNSCSLTTAPELPATTLARGCYKSMFMNCRNLTTAHELPATSTAVQCYDSMFMNCSSLTTAPVLPAEYIDVESYYSMFRGCTSLTYVKCLAERFSIDSTRDWLYEVSPTGTFVKAPNSYWTTGANGIPEGWTVIENND